MKKIIKKIFRNASKNNTKRQYLQRLEIKKEINLRFHSKNALVIFNNLFS
jgi:hypothetical protein